MFPHRYEDYTDQMELVYHLHYEHSVPMSDALLLDDPTTTHRLAHS